MDPKAREIELKQKKLALLRQMRDYQQANLLEFFNSDKPLVDKTLLRANPKQQLILDAWQSAQKKTFVYVGGNRSGKTTLGCILAVSTTVGYWMWNKEPLYFPHRRPRKVRIVGQDWESSIMKVVIPELQKWWPKNRPVKIKKNNVGADAYWTDQITGSTIEVMSSKQDSMVHEGGNHDLLIFDEPVSKAHYTANARGLVDRQGKEIFTMTLLKEAWVDRDIIKRRLDDGRPDPSVFVVQTQSTDNVGYGITQVGLNQFIGKLDKEDYEARILGIPKYMSGLVYPQFKRESHIKERFQIPLDWPVDIMIDIHPRKEQAVLFMATAPNGWKYCIHEIWEHGDGKKVAEDIIRIVKWGNYRVNRVAVDPLAKGDSNQDNTTFDIISQTIGRFDMMLETASKDKDTGILKVKEHLKGPNNEPSLFFFDDLVRTLYEIEGYMWDKDTQKASKVDDDMMENLYRLTLLDTEYTEPIEDDAADDYDEPVNATTGY